MRIVKTLFGKNREKHGQNSQLTAYKLSGNNHTFSDMRAKMQTFTIVPEIPCRTEKTANGFSVCREDPPKKVYRSRMTFQASASRSTLHAALAGLVDGRQTAGRPVCGSVYR